MLALKYIGLPEGARTVIQDAREAEPEAGFYGPELEIVKDQIVPLEAFHNNERFGDVASLHCADILGDMGLKVSGPLAVRIEIDETGAERELAPEPAAEPAQATSEEA